MLEEIEYLILLGFLMINDVDTLRKLTILKFLV